MNVSSPSQLASLAAQGKPLQTATALSGQAGTKPPVSKARHAVQELEAQILADWLQSLQQALEMTGHESDPAVGENYRYLTTQALASQLASHGGLGIGTMLLHALHLEDDGKGAAGAKALPVPADSHR
jgi:Rod binding domain-containing protein